MRWPALLLSVSLAATLWAQSPLRRGFSITITEPQNQELVFGKTKIVAEVEIPRPDDVDRVEFLIGDDVIFVDREPPYECLYDFGADSKTWIVRAVAYHKEAVSVSDAIITRKLAVSAIERVNRVILWVSATDKKGELLTDLSRDELRVLEDGVEQEIIDFVVEERPIKLAILLDTSGSMQDRLKKVHGAASAFVDTLREQDEALVIDFDDRVFLIQDRTSDREALKQAIESTEPQGGTAIYDALHAAYRKLQGIEGRRVIVLLSDGADSASQFSFKRVIEEAKAKNVMIYAVALGGGQGDPPRRDVMREFADITGGRFHFVKTASELGTVYQRIAEELGKQYLVTYSTKNEVWDGRWIKLKIESTRRNVEMRARRGYFAVRSSN